MKFAALIFTIFGGDFFLKNYMEKHLKWGEEKGICKGRILLRRYHNSGAALNILNKCQKTLKVICGGMLLILGAVWFLLMRKKDNFGIMLGLSLLLGGGASNYYDRIFRGYVVDYFSFHTSWKWLDRIIFNISDLCTFLGGIMVMLKCKRGFLV